jgi:hypothetical protein
MRKLGRGRFGVLVAFVMFVTGALPAFAGQACKTCRAETLSNGSSIIACTDPDDGAWGNEICRITCMSEFCVCEPSGPMCLYITVNG